MTQKSMVKKWELYFGHDEGYENRFTIMKAFANFFERGNIKTIEIPGKCVLGGEVFGRDGFNDGDKILTSYVKTIERIDHWYRNGVPHDLMCAITVSGSKYYFYSDEYNAYMSLMLGDMINFGKLDGRRYYYLPPEFHGSDVLI